MPVSTELGLEQPVEMVSEAETSETVADEPAVVEPLEEVGDSSEPEPVIVEAPALADDQLDHLLKIKVDGQESWITAAEAAQGYQRHEDYSRKTQALAAQEAENEAALQLANAYATDPDLTIRVLAEKRGIQLASNQAQTPSETEYQTPEEQELAKRDARIAELEAKFEANEAQTYMEREFAALESKVGSLDRQALLSHITATGVTNVEAAWAHMNLDAAVTGRAGAANVAAKAAVVDAKREAQVVHKPTTGAVSSQSPTSSEVPKSLREAALMAENGIQVAPEHSLPAWFR